MAIKWTEEELKVVHEWYVTIGPTRIHKVILPNRTPVAIHMKGRALGYTYDRSAKPKQPYVSKAKTRVKPNEPVSGVYRIDWDSGHYYIGSSCKLKDRLRRHDKIKNNRHLGDHTITILKDCFGQDLKYFEGIYITNSISDPMCLNQSIPRP